ncbi:rhodanese-like domain-containing protein [Sphaerobacter sp.]|uniref:rhodanese-like domain-containing protein n=1 Tax=Sphaerobacter sp. TaxID=2099654 RepID=UPI001D8F1EEC|nr:rhodanese-like domain-containing protein [Sphaerobacter sp.]MBX5445063.1 rhodanese-like domain-containing protein [Sphaerobacter sp.]
MAKKTAAEMVAEAKSRIRNLSPDEVAAELKRGNVVLVDLREPEEREENGTIPGSIAAPRGMLEFYADPTTSYHREEFDPEQDIILYCSAGGRSALAADTLQQMGFRRVAHLEGGFTAWRDQGLPVEP